VVVKGDSHHCVANSLKNSCRDYKCESFHSSEMFSRVIDPNNLFRFGRKSDTHPRPSDVRKKSASYRDTGQALHSAAEEKADEISQNLSSDNGHSQPPSPSPPLDPTCGGQGDHDCKRQK
jgi:hypothetical protein